MPDSLTIETRLGVRTLTLNRPQKRNALNQELTIALLDALDQAEGDDEVACVVLTAVGTVFCAGADLGEVKNFATEDAAAYEQRLVRAARLSLILSGMKKTVLAAVNGAAIGVGASLALGADIVVMAQSARLGYPEVRHGMVPISVMPLLIHAANPKLAFELLAVGDDVDAAQALSLGLVNKVVPDAELQDHVRALAERLATYDHSCLSLTKQLFHKMVGRPLGDAVEIALAASRARAAARLRA